jgi:hypothetical protein
MIGEVKCDTTSMQHTAHIHIYIYIYIYIYSICIEHMRLHK